MDLTWFNERCIISDVKYYIVIIIELIVLYASEKIKF